ncbi:hypothetical protein SU69_01485 [Thermosipho melanesiensis]|uniref:DUF4895 domain-containing protein n=2 Tax=Thermosipho melanesiensis TaxID=46541 RepID=A6LJQ3_THEM4|nr:DUF4895 domain-containing protein [Thermosipho melanesiensis]ABR30154.1 hypothetical protein Tmel_0282 [Thermosipho melanesiensis BI429]APT73353.1 hypothetical protein BW47_01540 [Thermosipho melanesiensis]OOC38168.1 hypothetical protein SU68_01490 [Thermosipho melanesiensis]OOC40089.1 hypothetical protein SU70_01485 [Thermosipho melanesiensis]OOC40142.1 hypothetical protein SU69_01485 [Thermosipho melanesiensis]
MVYFGPEKLRPVFEETRKILEKDRKKLVEFLYSYKEVLDVFHKHLMLVSICSEGVFSLNVGYTPEEKFFFGISLSNPFLKTPSFYKLKDYFNEGLENLYISNFTKRSLPKITAGILKFPILTHFLALGGEKSLISKELFSEEVTGKNWLSFSKKVDDKTYEKFLDLNGKKYGFLRIFLTDDGVYFVGIGEENRNLYAEFFTFLKNKYMFQSGKYFPVSDLRNNVIGMFKIELNDLDAKWKYVESFVKDFEKFRDFLKGLGG